MSETEAFWGPISLTWKVPMSPSSVCLPSGLCILVTLFAAPEAVYVFAHLAWQ